MDEDSLSAALIAGLRRAGLDVLTVLEAQRLGMSDADQLWFSTISNRVIVTANGGDFLALHTRVGYVMANTIRASSSAANRPSPSGKNCEQYADWRRNGIQATSPTPSCSCPRG
jgi:hypothetical protein